MVCYEYALKLWHLLLEFFSKFYFIPFRLDKWKLKLKGNTGSCCKFKVANFDAFYLFIVRF